MLTQYWEIKNQHQDYLILFRVGDFFELFYDDAVKASGVLNITLTKKSYGKGEENQDYPMCGMPHHSYLHYCYKLVLAGYKIVVCDQMETPEEAKLAKRPVVQRSITKILTKSTIYYENFSWDDLNHFLISLTYNVREKSWFVLMADIATNEFFHKYIPWNELQSFITKINPEEILISKYDENLIFMESELINFKSKIQKTPTIDHIPVNDSWQKYKNHLPQWQQFNLNTLLSYLITHGINMDNCHNVPVNFPFQESMGLSTKTIKQLNLLPSMSTGISSIFQIIDYTSTPMGKRLLQKYLLFPSTNLDLIQDRQNKIKFFQEFLSHDNINLNNLGDLQKYLKNIINKTIKPLELLKMAQSLHRCLDIFNVLNNHHYSKKFNHQLYVISLVLNTMENEIHVAEGKIIKSNNLPLLKDYGEKLQNIDHEIKILLDNYGHQFKISSIKLKYDQKNGYFMECPKSQEKTIHENNYFNIIQFGISYVRFISEKFITLTQTKNTYQQLINQINYNIYDELLNKVMENIPEIEAIIEDMAVIDVFKGLSKLITNNHWILPQVNNNDPIIIEGGYHPLVKHFNDNFIANDLTMVNNNFHIITGPNMGGKSTFLRQNAIIFILAQMGAPIPAQKGILGIIDNIFTRIGADDNLMEGESTFMVEMEEMAHMIKEATPKSLLIIDELGRGTSVKDGLAIAQSIIEYLVQLKCKCLFSTHFHQLHKLINYEGIQYFHCGYFFKPQLQFTYKIMEGVTEESFGIHVAELAGLPKNIIDKAKGYLN